MRFPITADGSKISVEKDWYVAQGFGAQTTYGFHEGVDWNLKTGGDTDLGQEIKAIANGRIVYYHYSSHPTTGFGRHLVYRIDGAWGSRWVHCCHLQENGFLSGAQDVTEGQIIGRLGKSGTSAAHLHFAIYKVDPVGFGIDNIANNQTELNQYWEDPITFIETWMAAPTPAPVPINDQTKYDFGTPWDIMELGAVRSKMNDQQTQIVNKDNEITQLKTKITNAKNILS